jgi:hypothetical protein
MNNLDDDIKKALASAEGSYDLDREEEYFRKMSGLSHRSRMMWWMATAIMTEVVCAVFAVLATKEFFRTDDTKWQIFYATGVVLSAQLLLLVKLWGWMRKHRYVIQWEIKRVELQILELRGSKPE